MKQYVDFKTVSVNDNLVLSIKEAGKTVTAIKASEKIVKVITTVLTYAFLLILAFFIIFPFYWMIITSLKTLEEITATEQTFFPTTVMWTNYVYIFQRFDFSSYMVNTVVVAIISTVGTLITTVFAALAFSRLQFKGRETVFAIFLMTMMIPGEMMVISNYITVASFGWIDAVHQTRWQAYAAMTVPMLVSVFYIYLLR